MWYDRNMDYYQRINMKFDKGILDGQKGIYKPGSITGVFRQAYLIGNKEGAKIRRLILIKK